MLREQLTKEGKDFDEVFKKIHDIAIKALISITDIELKAQENKRIII